MQDVTDLSALFTIDSSFIEPPNTSPAFSASALEFLEKIHRRNSELLKNIIAHSGWPAASRVGDKAEAAAFMIAQHSDYDPDFQRLCHMLLLQSTERGTTKERGFLAFLTDRILCNAGKPQRFGTQLREVQNGCFVPKPMEDPDHIEELRTQAGLTETLADYLQRINDGDMIFYRPLLNGYIEQLDHMR